MHHQIYARLLQQSLLKYFYFIKYSIYSHESRIIVGTIMTKKISHLQAFSSALMRKMNAIFLPTYFFLYYFYTQKKTFSKWLSERLTDGMNEWIRILILNCCCNWMFLIHLTFWTFHHVVECTNALHDCVCGFSFFVNHDDGNSGT